MKKEAKKKKWPKKMVKAWKHRIEQYRYAIRSGKIADDFFEGSCCICDVVHCGDCPFEIVGTYSPSCWSPTRGKAVDAVYRLEDKTDPGPVIDHLRARLKEIIAIGRETGVIE